MKKIIYYYLPDCVPCKKTTKIIDELINNGHQINKQNFNEIKSGYRPPKTPFIRIEKDGELYDAYSDYCLGLIEKNMQLYPQIHKCANLYEYFDLIFKEDA